MSQYSPHQGPFHTLAQRERTDTQQQDTETAAAQRLQRIFSDFERGFDSLRQETDTVTFFGSARLQPDNRYYQQARTLSQRIATELGATIVTGGGRGIMAAANQGASDAGGKSIGMTIELPCEDVSNQYVDESVDFYYFFSRKVALSFTARAFIYFPGGFGTLDEFFEILTLKQTGRIQSVPIILVGKEYWQPLLDFIQQQLITEFGTVSQGENRLFQQLDDEDKIINALST